MSTFTELLQISVGKRAGFSRHPSHEEWHELFALSKRHALLGITFHAIEQLPIEQRPPRQLLLKWGVHAESIVERNKFLNGKVIELSQHFRNDGFCNVILKGQGVAQYYQVAGLELYRTPGDVDLWLDGSRKEIIDYVRRNSSKSKIVYHHVDFPKMDGVDVELHFTPSWMNSPITNYRLQRYFEQQRRSLFDKQSNIPDIPMPDVEFNRVYILLHIYRHLFHTGIGLRQFMDYYFVLQQGFTPEERRTTIDIIRKLGMERFASAVMWVMQELFCLDPQYAITPPDRVYGESLLNEIMVAGNLGMHDTSISHKRGESPLSHGVRKVRRTMRFIQTYPSEVLWGPIFKIWHYVWRKTVNNNLSIHV